MRACVQVVHVVRTLAAGWESIVSPSALYIWSAPILSFAESQGAL